jgi:uncharacterized glyoxalase superfamily protein PhnB
MGNTYCAGAREKLEEKHQATKEFLSRASYSVKKNYEKTKKSTKEKISAASLRVQGYSLNVFEDNGETKVVSDFENRLPIRFVTQAEFDQPLGRLHTEGLKTVTVDALIEIYEK